MSAQFGIVCGKCTLWCNALCGQQYGQCVMLSYSVGSVHTIMCGIVV